MTMKKILATVMSAVLMVGLISGCAGKGNQETSEQVTVRIGGWPYETNKEEYARMNQVKEKFEAENPNIKIVPDDWQFDLDNFLPKAAAGQLPDAYVTSLTEIKRIISSGYASDISKYMKKYKYTDYLRDYILNVISDEDGKIYAVPTTGYMMGLLVNMTLFREAGLLNEDGTPKVPETWEQVAEFAQTIKEKTGQAGFAMATMNNVGGWHFMNIAWSHGVTPEFAKQENGKWVADFATPEGVAALQYVKDLKWKYNAVPENALLDFDEMYKMFATNRVGMMMADPPLGALVNSYGMDKSNEGAVSMPAGPKGRYTQIGSSLYVFRNGVTDEQIDAIFKWLEFNGYSPEINEAQKENIESRYKVQNERNQIVAVKPYGQWKDDKLAPVKQYENEIIDTYTNVDARMFADFQKFDKVTPLSEPPVCCQQLYSLLDGCIQKVWTDQNANPEEVLKKAASDYQVNYLDKMK